MISLIIPSYNNLEHLKNAYNSVRKHYTDKVELILIDDGSDDGTFEWLQSLKDPNSIIWREEKRIGHTILYDRGISKATNDIPLHPEGKEKIVKDFGMDFDSLKMDNFYLFAEEEMIRMKDKTTKGMFAPWIIYKSDFEAIGGHDHGFAPFPYEDSDIFQRWILNGYELIQSRDALTYHLTCRGHRWNKEIGKNDDEFKQFEKNARKYYLQKWGSWVKNDEWGHPIISPVYNKTLILNNCNDELKSILEPWGNGGDDVIVEINGSLFNHQDYQYLEQLHDVIEEQGEIGEFTLGNLKININNLKSHEKDLIICKKY